MRRRSRRLSPALAVARYSIQPGTRNFPAVAINTNGVFQGYSIDIKLDKLLNAPTTVQDQLRADARLVFLRVVLPPNTTAVPLGVDIIAVGFPNLPSDGTVVGRTSRFLSTTNSTFVNCRLPAAVKQFWMQPYAGGSHYFQIRIRYYAEEPSAPAVLPYMTFEFKFHEQPIETFIVR